MSSNSAQAPTPYYASRSRILFPWRRASEIIWWGGEKGDERVHHNTHAGRGALLTLSLSLLLLELPLSSPAATARCRWRSDLPLERFKRAELAVVQADAGRRGCWRRGRVRPTCVTVRVCTLRAGKSFNNIRGKIGKRTEDRRRIDAW